MDLFFAGKRSPVLFACFLACLCEETMESSPLNKALTLDIPMTCRCWNNGQNVVWLSVSQKEAALYIALPVRLNTLKLRDKKTIAEILKFYR